MTSTLNPEYGRNSGTIINAAIKNGTNQFHGDGFEFYRDTFLDAKNYFEQQASPFHQNEYGGTIGGPIVKNRAFFFFSYQGLHQERLPQAGSSNAVPVFSPRRNEAATLVHLDQALMASSIVPAAGSTAQSSVIQSFPRYRWLATLTHYVPEPFVQLVRPMESYMIRTTAHQQRVPFFARRFVQHRGS